MTEQHTITESDLEQIAQHNGILPTPLRGALRDAGITVVPDPAPPLPTEPGTVWRDSVGQTWLVIGSGEIVCAIVQDERGNYWRNTIYQGDPQGFGPFERLETQAEGDARVLNTIYSTDNRSLSRRDAVRLLAREVSS